MFKQLLILLMVFNAINLNAQWKSMGSDDFPGAPGDMIFHVHALDEDNVWGLLFKAATFAPTQTYFKTVDGGATITTHEIEVEDPSLTAFAIHAHDESTAWVAMTSEPCQCYGQVYKTENGGETWQKKFSEDSDQSILGIYFWDENEGFAIGGNGTGSNTDQSVFYRTFDGGDTWEETTSPLIQPGESHWLASGNSLYDVIGDQIFFGTRHGRIFKSVDRGMTWEVSLELANFRTISDIAFQDELNGIAISAMAANGAPVVNSGWKTSDGGLSWDLIDIPQAVSAYTIEFVPGTNGSYVISGGFDSENILLTRSLGAHWAEVKSPRFIGMTFVSPTIAYGGSLIQEAGLFKLVSSFSDTHVNVKTIVGNRFEGFEINEPLKSNLYNPKGMEMDSEGNLYIANDYGNNILKLSADGSELLNYAGTPGFPNNIDVDPLSDDLFNSPQDLAFDEAGNLFVADAYNNQIKVISTTGEVSVYAGTGEVGDLDGNISTATFDYPVAICFDSNDNLLIGELFKIRKIAPDGTVTTLAGSGVSGNMDGVGSSAAFNFIYGMAIDDADNLFVTDIANSKIRKINPNGVVTTFAGTGEFGYVNGPGNVAQFDGPEGIAIDKSNNIYVGDGINGFIRKIDVQGNVTSVAGVLTNNAYAAGPGAPGPQIRDGDGSKAIFSRSRGLYVKPNGNLLHTEWGSDVVREIQFGVPSLPITVRKILNESKNVSHIDHIDDYTFGANVTNTSADAVEEIELRVIVSLDGSAVMISTAGRDIIEIGETKFMLIEESFKPESVGTYQVEYIVFVEGDKLVTLEDEIIVSDSVMGYDDYHPYLVGNYNFFSNWDNGFGMAYDLNQLDTIIGMELFLSLEEASVIELKVFEVNAFGFLEAVYNSGPITIEDEFYGMYHHEIPPIFVEKGKYLFAIKGIENLINVGFDNDHLSDQLWMLYQNTWGTVEELLNGYVELAGMIHPVLKSTPTIINTNEIEEVSIDIFPNPFAASITINQHQSKELTVSLIDISGKILLEKFSHDEIIQLGNLDHLPAGAYLVRVKGEDFIIDKPVVKN